MIYFWQKSVAFAKGFELSKLLNGSGK